MRNAFLALLLFLCGCDQRVLVTDLSQSQATEIIVALHQSGIDAERVEERVGRKKSYQIAVAKGNFGTALEILQNFGLLPKKSEKVEELTRQQGFLPNSPELSQVRLSYALSAQIEELLAALPGVVDVHAVVRLAPDQSLFSESAPEHYSAASVVIRYVTKEGEIPFSVDKVKSLVSHSVSGLRVDDVHVETSAIPVGELKKVGESLIQLSPFLITFKVAASERERALKQLALLVLVVVACSSVLGFFLGWRRVRGGSKNYRKAFNGNLLEEGRTSVVRKGNGAGTLPEQTEIQD